MKDGKVFIWMNLIGFERNDPDKGAQRFLDQTGFVPDGAMALVWHPDFFLLHRGMEKEYELFPDNCSYWAVPRNAERERQPWTNYDLRTLSNTLLEKGTGLYASIFGSVANNAFHKEWYSEHEEIRNHYHGGPEKAAGHYILKRFKDGTYFEDFFIDKVCQALQDYNLKGVHLADNLCPVSACSIQYAEYSTDFVDQFLTHTGVTLPNELAATMGDDREEAETKRAMWIYSNVREEWIRFHAWRWEQFFKKICTRVHAIGKEVMTLGMYCTDPFETLYCLGVNQKKIVDAGVDYITANILPTGTYIAGSDARPYYFNRYMAIAPTAAAHLPKGHLVSMLGLQDATEEWSAIHHAPCMHEKDMFSVMAYHMVDEEGPNRAMEGYCLCLGDGVPRSDWDWERERLEIAMTAKAKQVMSPSMLWSENAHEAMLHEYIHTRRWTPFKLFYELANAGVHLAATVKPEGLKNFSGTLVVPNFDMLTADEQKAVAAYDKGAVLCTASPDFDPVAYGITPKILFSDRYSDYPMTAFAFGCDVSEEVKAQIEALLAVDDGEPNLVGPVDQLFESFPNVLMNTLLFAKVTTGFRDAMALLLNEINDIPFKIDKQNIVLQMPDGAYRLYLYNDSMVKYHRAFVQSENPIADVKIISKFPILPPRYVEEATDALVHAYAGEIQEKRNFEIKIQPGGVTVVDVYCK